MSEINWKAKYQALKAKYLEDLDVAFRTGYEQGAQSAQMDNMAQQQQQQADQMAVQMGMQGDGQGDDPNQDPNAGSEIEGQAPPMSANPQGSELDKHINELESMLQKSEPTNPADLILLVNKIQGLRKAAAQEIELKKSAQAISGIAKALHKPQFKMSQQAKSNLTANAKAAVSMQEQIVRDVMSTWDKEEKKTGGDIISQLKAEGIIKE